MIARGEIVVEMENVKMVSVVTLVYAMGDMRELIVNF